MAADNRDVDQVSRPFQIALVAVVLLGGMWFTVLRPKPETASSTPAAAAPVAPGTKGLSTAVDKAKGAAAASDAANAATQAATGEAAKPSATPAAKPAATPAAKPSATKATTAAKPATKAATKAPADPSAKALASLSKGKTVVFLFYGNGADDRAARRAVRRAVHGDHHVTFASAPITKVGKYEALTSDVEVLTSPTILVIGKDHEAVSLTGYVDARNVTQAIGDVRRAAKKK